MRGEKMSIAAWVSNIEVMGMSLVRSSGHTGLAPVYEYGFIPARSLLVRAKHSYATIRRPKYQIMVKAFKEQL